MIKRERIALPTPGMVWVCKICNEKCNVTRQDIGPYEGRERYYDWRTDCCSGFYDEEAMND
jgi:hypothetical protein